METLVGSGMPTHPVVCIWAIPGCIRSTVLFWDSCCCSCRCRLPKEWCSCPSSCCKCDGLSEGETCLEAQECPSLCSRSLCATVSDAAAVCSYAVQVHQCLDWEHLIIDSPYAIIWYQWLHRAQVFPMSRRGFTLHHWRKLGDDSSPLCGACGWWSVGLCIAISTPLGGLGAFNAHGCLGRVTDAWDEKQAWEHLLPLDRNLAALVIPQRPPLIRCWPSSSWSSAMNWSWHWWGTMLSAMPYHPW